MQLLLDGLRGGLHCTNFLAGAPVETKTASSSVSTRLAIDIDDEEHFTDGFGGRAGFGPILGRTGELDLTKFGFGGTGGATGVTGAALGDF